MLTVSKAAGLALSGAGTDRARWPHWPWILSWWRAGPAGQAGPWEAARLGPVLGVWWWMELIISNVHVLRNSFAEG